MFTLYSADFINAPSNCSYPHKFEVTDSANFADAVSRDAPTARRHQFQRHIIEREQHAVGAVAGIPP